MKMKVSVIFAAIGCILLAGCASNTSPASDPATVGDSGKEAPAPVASKEIEFAADYQTASEQAKKEHKMILVKFTAEWCGPCQQMKKEAFTDSTVKTELENVVPVEIDIDNTKEKDFMKKYYTADGIPFTILLKEDGTKVDEVLGYDNVKSFVDWLKTAKGKASS